MTTSSSYPRVLALAAALSIGFFCGIRCAVADLGDCAQPVSGGANPVASDCLFILNVAVGLQDCTPEDCVCDPNGQGGTTASDALMCLSAAVGGSIELQCPCATTTTTTTVTTTTLPNNVNCSNDGTCANDHCVCSDCDNDLFCRDPNHCNHNGTCDTFVEGCVCEDCTNHPECLDN